MAEEHGVENDLINNFLNQKTKFHGEFLRSGRFQDIYQSQKYSNYAFFFSEVKIDC